MKRMTVTVHGTYDEEYVLVSKRALEAVLGQLRDAQASMTLAGADLAFYEEAKA